MTGAGATLSGEGFVGGGWLAGVRGQAYKLWSWPNVQGIRPLHQLAVVAGAVFGRRIETGPLSFDLLLRAPEVAIENSSWGNDSLIPQLNQVGDDEQRNLSPDGTSTYRTYALRAGAGARASIRVDRWVRAYTDFGVDASLLRWVPVDMPAFARLSLPSWGAGFSMGLLWEAF
jgi:hypothetical protein